MSPDVNWTQPNPCPATKSPYLFTSSETEESHSYSLEKNKKKPTNNNKNHKRISQVFAIIHLCVTPEQTFPCSTHQSDTLEIKYPICVTIKAAEPAVLLRASLAERQQ